MDIKTIRLSIFDGIELKDATFRHKSFPYHFHDSYSIGIIECGMERLFYGSKEVIGHAHSVTIINPYDIHANSYFDSDLWKYKAIYVTKELMRYIQDNTGLFKRKDIWFPQQLIDDPYLYSLIFNFHENPCNEPKLLNVILTYIIQRYACKQPEEQKKNTRISDAMLYMSTHFSDKMNLAEIAAQYGMDKYKFIRMFKKQSGLTPISYILMHRINKSKALIAENMPITEVALETGFYDQSHYIHYFQKYIGISPLKYKKGLIENP